MARRGVRGHWPADPEASGLEGPELHVQQRTKPRGAPRRAQVGPRSRRGGESNWDRAQPFLVSSGPHTRDLAFLITGSGKADNV